MAIVVLVLWLLTAGAGFYLLVTSNLGRARPAGAAAASRPPAPITQAVPASVTRTAGPVQPASPAQPASATQAAPDAGQAAASRREMRRADRDPFAPPSLVASRQAPIVPDLRSLAEFAHPACAISGLGFWLGFTLVHFRVLGWIAFGLIVATACIGLAWFTANARAARRRGDGQPAPSFTRRLIVLHGGAAAVTLTLAALTILVIRG
jgi:hypothetical protein